MCPNEVIYRLLDVIESTLDKISCQKTLENVVSQLDYIKAQLDSNSIDKCG